MWEGPRAGRPLEGSRLSEEQGLPGTGARGSAARGGSEARMKAPESSMKRWPLAHTPTPAGRPATPAATMVGGELGILCFFEARLREQLPFPAGVPPAPTRLPWSSPAAQLFLPWRNWGWHLPLSRPQRPHWHSWGQTRGSEPGLVHTGGCLYPFLGEEVETLVARQPPVAAAGRPRAPTFHSPTRHG